MKSKISAIIFLLLSLIMVSSMAVQARWSYLQMATNSLSISNDGKATVNAKLVASKEVNKVTIDTELQQYKNGKWSTIKSWSAENSDYYTAISNKTYYVSKGYNYRVFSTYKAYINGSLKETATDIYTNSTYK